MSLFEGLGDELVDSPPLVDDKQNEPVRETVLGEPPKVNPFSGLGDELESPDPLRPTLGEAIKKNPDKYARAAQIAKEHGVAPSIVELSLDEFERQTQLQKLNIDQLSKEFPATAEFLRNFDNAAQFHDDVDTFKGLESAIKKDWWQESADELIQNSVDSSDTALGRFVGTDLPRLMRSFGAAAIATGEKSLAGLISAFHNEATKHIPKDQLEEFDAFVLGGTIDNDKLPQQLYNEGQAVLEEIKRSDPMTTKGGEVLSGAINSIIQQIPGLSLGVLTGNPGVALSLMSMSTFGQVYGDSKAGGMSNEDALHNAVVQGFTEGATELIPFIKFASLVRPGATLTKEAVQQVLAGEFKPGKRFGRRAVEYMLAEFPGEALATAIQNSSDVYFSEDDPALRTQQMRDYLLSSEHWTQDQVDTFLQTAVQTSLMIGGGKVIDAAANGFQRWQNSDLAKQMDAALTEQQRKGIAEQKKIDQLTTLVQESKAAVKRNPDGVREFMQQAATEGDSVYMPAQPILEYLVENDIDPYTDPVFQGIARQIDEAAGLGGDIVVPLADFATSIAVSDHMEALRPHMRLSADTAAPSEVKAFQEAQQTWVNKLVEEAEAEATVFEEAQSVYEEVREKLVGTGRATEAVAKLQAQVIPAYVTRLAVATGRGVRELFDEIALDIRGPFTEQQAANAERAAVLQQEANRLVTVKTGDTVDGYTVRDEVPNMSSIAATLDDYTILEGIREVPMSAFDPEYLGSISIERLDKRTRDLMEQIQASKELNPLIVAYDSKGAYIIEGGHRFDALIASGAKSIPAVVVIDESDAPSVQMDQDGVEYRQGQIVTETENFKRWFGDSKVVDESGAPLVVYHGGGEKIIDFSNGPARGFLGVAYFTGDKKVAWKYALGGGIDQRKNLAEYRRRQLAQLPSRQPNVTRVYLRMENPFYGDSSRAWGEIRKTFSIEEILAAASGNWTGDRISELADENEISKAEVLEDYWDDLAGDLGGGTFLEHDNDSLAESPAIKFLEFTGLASEFHKRNGYDGYVFEDAESGGKTYVPFSPTQIKSVFNRGTFDPTDPNILNQSQPSGTTPRGIYDSTANMIRLMEASDLSTFLHESAHFFLEMEKRFNPAGVAAINEWFGRNAAAVAMEANKYLEQDATDTITEQHVLQWLADGATGDARVDEAIKRATHEQFARGFETYLMEGKAPSLELREAFRAFARWLTDLYRKIKGDLNVKLDDQMRAVFDRLLATEDQIAAVEAANRYRPLFTDAAMAGMTEEEFADYQKKQEAPTAKAKETLQEKIFAQLKRETEGWWQEEKAERVKTIVEQLRNQPVYNATETLREKGGEIKLDRAAVKEMLGVDRVPDQLRGMTLTGMQGVSLDDAAAFFGYASGHQMISEIMAARPIRQVAAEQAEAEMKAEHGDILNDGTLEREAQDAAHNEERGKQILVELKALARSQNRPTIDRAAIKALAEENIGRLPLTRILPHKYRRAEIRAAQAAQQAMDKGDRGAALQAKMQQAMNFYLWRAATDARIRADKIVRFTRKYKKASIRQQIAKAGNGYLEQIDGILERFAFDTSVKKVTLERQDIAEWAEERAEAGDNLQLTREVLSEQMRKHYKEIPFDTLLGVYDSIRNIDHIARFANKVKKDGELLDFLEVKREVLAHLDNLPVKYKTRTSVAARQTTGKKALWHIAQMTKLPVLFTWLDGGKRAGLMHKLLGQPFTDAAQARQRLYREVGLPIVAAIRERSKADQKRHNQKIYIPEAVSEVNDGTFMQHELISVALNTGNLSNLEKMLKGEGWVSPDAAMEEISVDNPKLQAILSYLTDSDWTLVETIWSQIDQLFPLMAEVHKRTSGLELPKIAATDFTVQVRQPNGTVRERKIAGGYYPVKYDSERGDRAEQNEAKQQAMLDSLFGGPNGMLKPSATTGAKIERTDYFAPIRFSLDVVPNHVDEVIQYITHYEAVQQVYKLTNDSEIKKAIKERVGTAEYNQIRPWLNDIAKDGRETPPKQLWDPLLRRLRFGTTLGMMGFKASTGLMQISGLSNSVAEVGVGPMLRALRHVSGALFSPRSGSATEMWQFVTERSKIMADRINTMDRELMNAMSAIRNKSGILKAAQETGMKHIAYIQTYTVDLPTWYGAYYKGLEEAKAQLDAEDFASFEAYSEALEAQAVRRADWTVENVQGSGMTKDMAQIMRNQTETGRMLTMFFTFFSSLWNMQRDTIRGARSGQYGITSLAAKLLFLYAIPVAYEMAIRGELEDDDDDDKTTLEKYLTRLAIYPTATVPIVRDVVNAAVSGFDFQMTPVASIIEKGIKGSTKLSEGALTDEEISLAQTKNAAKLVGALFGLPGVSQAFSTGEHLYDVIEEGEELTARELLFGPRRH